MFTRRELLNRQDTHSLPTLALVAVIRTTGLFVFLWKLGVFTWVNKSKDLRLKISIKEVKRVWGPANQQCAAAPYREEAGLHYFLTFSLATHIRLDICETWCMMGNFYWFLDPLFKLCHSWFPVQVDQYYLRFMKWFSTWRERAWHSEKLQLQRFYWHDYMTMK